MGVSAVAVLLAACTGPQIRGGAYVNAAKGFAVPLPAAGWTVETYAEPDLLLHHASGRAGISVHATCGGIPDERRVEIASRHLFFGIQDKQIVREHGYTVKGPGCLYDLVLFAAREDYADVNGDFETLVQGFRRSTGQPW
jgi:hypothetical protein